MKLLINGKEEELVFSTIAELVQGRAGENAAGIAVARNGAVVPRSVWAYTVLRPGDTVEVVSATPGG